MARKKQKRTLDEDQSQADYELLAAENEQLEKTSTTETNQSEEEEPAQSTTSFLDLPPLDDDSEENLSAQRNYTYGEFHVVGIRVLEWIRTY